MNTSQEDHALKKRILEWEWGWVGINFFGSYYISLEWEALEIHYRKQGIFQRPVAIENKLYLTIIIYFHRYLAADTNWPKIMAIFGFSCRK
jgi:hypothetical protein